MNDKTDISLENFEKDKFISLLSKGVLLTVRILATLMVVVIFWSLLDVGYHLYMELATNTISSIFSVDNIFELLGGFLAVLIAIEVYLNIIFYLKKDSVHVPLVLATALTAVARKVIVLDYQNVAVEHIYATAALILSVGISYWLVTVKKLKN